EEQAMRLAFFLSAAVIITSPAVAETSPEQHQQDQWLMTLQVDCIVGDMDACHEIGFLRYPYRQPSQSEIHDGSIGPHASMTSDQECNRGTLNGLTRLLVQQGGSSVDGAEPWPPPPLLVSSCD
ncbi:hypothetical protein, partial [Falsiroseomonas sp. E2-1-a20]|uniref:hypothetical protein n=1 Tax=Falsiroseomonas sp. E2-1-a20 TaxID=3239300 RepID=UPI003F391BB5